jgi:transposase
VAALAGMVKRETILPQSGLSTTRACTDAACRVSSRVVMHVIKDIGSRGETRQDAPCEETRQACGETRQAALRGERWQAALRGETRQAALREETRQAALREERWQAALREETRQAALHEETRQAASVQVQAMHCPYSN